MTVDLSMPDKDKAVVNADRKKERGAAEAAPSPRNRSPLGSGLRSILSALIRSLLQSGLGLSRECSETRSVVRGDVGQNLTVQTIAGKLQPVDERRVTHIVDPAGRVDADDPESAELALLLFASGIGEFERALDCFLRCLVELGFGEEVTTRALQNLLAAVVTFCTPFYTGHRDSPFAYIV